MQKTHCVLMNMSNSNGSTRPVTEGISFSPSREPRQTTASSKGMHRGVELHTRGPDRRPPSLVHEHGRQERQQMVLRFCLSREQAWTRLELRGPRRDNMTSKEPLRDLPAPWRGFREANHAATHV